MKMKRILRNWGIMALIIIFFISSISIAGSLFYMIWGELVLGFKILMTSVLLFALSAVTLYTSD